jgi:type II secretory pathway component PulF
MTNPYQPPTAAISRTFFASRGAAVFFAIGLICALLSAAVPTLIVPQFSRTFDAFGPDLPLLTQWVLSYHSILWALPALVLVAWFFWPAPQHRPLASCLIGTLGLLLLTPLVIYALYAPIFGLAETI